MTNKVVRTECTRCKLPTRHEVIFEHEVSGNTPGDEFPFRYYYQVIECRGCGDVSFRRTYETAKDWDPETGEMTVYEILYPPRTSERILMRGLEYFPPKVSAVYQETVKAINADLRILAAIGLRTLIESVCVEEGTAGDNLQESIEELAHQGFISSKQAEFLHRHRFMGNVAAHEIRAPRRNRIEIALEIAETLLKAIYVLPKLDDEFSGPTTTTTAPG